MILETLTHNGEEYRVIDTGEPSIIYCGSGDNPKARNQVNFQFELSGCHEGPPCLVVALNVHENFDPESTGRTGTFDSLIWEDDHSSFDNTAMLDAYHDGIADEVHDIVVETWD